MEKTTLNNYDGFTFFFEIFIDSIHSVIKERNVV